MVTFGHGGALRGWGGGIRLLPLTRGIPAENAPGLATGVPCRCRTGYFRDAGLEPTFKRGKWQVFAQY